VRVSPCSTRPQPSDDPQRAVEEIAAASGVSNNVTHIIYSHHHADHGSAFEGLLRESDFEKDAAA
jgi:glyoxylase-like metal-dependent hydrolase (beta-lactamase superfamily II)